jgi:hypothetical protein
VLEYLPTKDARDEVIWGGCAVVARLPGGGPTVLFACVKANLPDDVGDDPGPQPTLVPATPSSETGAIVRLRFQCRAAGDRWLTLEPPSGEDGTLFLGAGYVMDPRGAELVHARIICGEE